MSSVITVNPEQFESWFAAVFEPLRRENRVLRDKLRECAEECAECDGAGVVTLRETLQAVDAGDDGEQQQPCAACHDIRELL